MLIIYPDTNIFLFGEKSQGFETAFAPDAGIFHAAERRAQIAQKPRVDPDDARFQFFGDAVRARWEKEFDAMLAETRLFHAARDLLDALAARHVEVVLASSGKPKHAQHALELLDADRRATAWTTSEDADRTKPHPELFETALEKVGAEPGDALVIGDATWDVEAASRLGIPAVALLCGGFGREDLAGVWATYDDPSDLIDHLDEVLRLAGQDAHTPPG